MRTFIEMPNLEISREMVEIGPVFDDPVAFFAAHGLDVVIVRAGDALSRAA